MNLKEKLLNKKNLWHLSAIVLFFIISAAYFAPALKGYTVDQGDVKNWAGMAQEIRDYRENSGDNVLWTNSMFGGMPAVQISSSWEGKGILFLARDILTLWLPQPISAMFLYFLGFYFLSMVLRMKPLIGMLGAVAYGLSSYFIVIVEAGHATKGFALAFAPFVIAAFLFAYQRKNWVLGVALSALFMALEINANHLQITYYMAFILAFLGFAELFKAINKGKFGQFALATGGILVAYGIALLINIGNIAGTLEYTKYTTRGGSELTIGPDGMPIGPSSEDVALIEGTTGTSYEEKASTGLSKEYITAWSYGRSETFSFIIPNYKGGKSIPIGANEDNEDALEQAGPQFRQGVAQSAQYWGDQPFTSGPVYIGIIVVFLAFLAMVYNKEKWKWALLSVTLLTIFLSWGKNYVAVTVLFPTILFLANIFLDKKLYRIILNAILILILMILIGGIGPESGIPSLTDFFINVVPGYDKFRAVSMILVVAELCIPLLAMLFLHKLWKKRKEIQENLISFFVVTGLFFFILIAFMFAPTEFNSFLTAQELGTLDTITEPQMRMQYDAFFGDLEATRIEIFQSDLKRTIGFFLVGAILVFAMIKISSKQKLMIPVLTGVLTLFILVDLLTVDLRYLNNEKQGKNYAQWIEQYKRRFPYSAGQAEKDILAFEQLGNPELKQKIDSAQTAAIKNSKSLGYTGPAASRYVDWTTYRTLNRNTNFRVFDFNNPFNSSYASYFNKSVGGYHGAKLGRFQELIEFHLGTGNKGVMDMLNVKYQIQHQDDQYGGTISQVINVNQGALGNVWFAKNIQKVKSSDEEIMAMTSQETYYITPKVVVPTFVNGVKLEGKTAVSAKDIIEIAPVWIQDTVPVDVPFQALMKDELTLMADSAGINWAYTKMLDSTILQIFDASYGGVSGWAPAQTTLIDERFNNIVSQESYTGTGTIQMTKYHPDHMRYHSNSTDKQLAVFSEIHYPIGWKAYVDGEEVDIARANYVLRAIEVPAGEHDIEFIFDLPSFNRSGMLAWVATFLILILLGLGIYLGTKKDFQEGEEEDDSEESESKPEVV